MAVFIGTDEAGYGPNLGPLVVSASVWRIPDEALRHDLYETLAEWVCAVPKRNGDDCRVAIADSKKLYQPGSGLATLERGVLASLRLQGAAVQRWREIWAALNPLGEIPLAPAPWHDTYDAPLPIAANVDHLDRAVELLTHALERTGTALLAVRSIAVFPEHWNDLLEKYDGKGAALSHVTLDLVRSLLGRVVDEPALVVCDKHGGRNHYGPLLQHYFPDDFVETHAESRALSMYRWGPPARRVEVRFAAKGEGFLPSALASMASKYLRELGMAAFNDFWGRHKPGLKPTAGYPVDARRFKADIAELQQSLGVSDRQLWRNR